MLPLDDDSAKPILVRAMALLAFVSSALLDGCGQSRPGGSEYLGEWEVSSNVEDRWILCRLEISRLSESFLMTGEDPGSVCNEIYAGVFTLTPEGNLQGAAERPMVIAFDRAKNQAVISGLGEIQYLTRVKTTADTPVTAASSQENPVVRDLVAGDRACYMELEDNRGERLDEVASFEVCDQPELVGQRVRLTRERKPILAMSCGGDPWCTRRDTVELVVAAETVP